MNRFADLLNSTLSPTHVVDLIDSFAAEIEDDIERDLRIWRDEWEGSVEGWLEEVEKLRDFARRRPDYLRSHTTAKFGALGALLIKEPVSGRAQ